MDNAPRGRQLHETGELKRRIDSLVDLFRTCRCCPRECGVDRLSGDIGFCRTGEHGVVASANLHFGEEPPISGSKGSGTIFFARCTMGCIFCQNYPLSHQGIGQPVGPEELADRFLALQRRGAHNLNFVTGSHVLLLLFRALEQAYDRGFRLPLVWNCSGYESLTALTLLDGLIDIYLPDIKYRDDELPDRFSAARDYARFNGPALREMFRQVGLLRCDREGIGRQGLIVRHLVLPGQLENTRRCLEYVARELSPRVHVSLMGQYFPAFGAVDHPELGRRLTRAEYETAMALLEEYGLENGWCQSLDDLAGGDSEVS